MNVWPLNKISNEEKSNILSQHRHVYNGYKAINPTVSNEQPLYVQDFAKDKEGMVINNKGVTKKYTNFAINESEDKGLCTECGGKLYEGECMECGSKMYEGECMECGDKMYEDIYDVDDLSDENKFDYVEGEVDDNMVYELEGAEYNDGDVMYELEIDEENFESNGPLDTYPVNEYDDFEFEAMESAFADMDEEDISGVQGVYTDMKRPYDFESDGPEAFNEEGEVDEMWGSVARMAAPIAVNYAVDKLTSEEDLEEEIDDDLKESFKTEKSRIMEMMNRMNIL